jgi:hypothetical protein
MRFAILQKNILSPPRIPNSIDTASKTMKSNIKKLLLDTDTYILQSHIITKKKTI